MIGSDHSEEEMASQKQLCFQEVKSERGKKPSAFSAQRASDARRTSLSHGGSPASRSPTTGSDPSAGGQRQPKQSQQQQLPRRRLSIPATVAVTEVVPAPAPTAAPVPAPALVPFHQAEVLARMAAMRARRDLLQKRMQKASPPASPDPPAPCKAGTSSDGKPFAGAADAIADGAVAPASVRVVGAGIEEQEEGQGQGQGQGGDASVVHQEEWPLPSTLAVLSHTDTASKLSGYKTRGVLAYTQQQEEDKQRVVEQQRRRSLLISPERGPGSPQYDQLRKRMMDSPITQLLRSRSVFRCEQAAEEERLRLEEELRPKGHERFSQSPLKFGPRTQMTNKTHSMLTREQAAEEERLRLEEELRPKGHERFSQSPLKFGPRTQMTNKTHSMLMREQAVAAEKLHMERLEGRVVNSGRVRPVPDRLLAKTQACLERDQQREEQAEKNRWRKSKAVDLASPRTTVSSQSPLPMPQPTSRSQSPTRSSAPSPITNMWSPARSRSPRFATHESQRSASPPRIPLPQRYPVRTEPKRVIRHSLNVTKLSSYKTKGVLVYEQQQEEDKLRVSEQHRWRSLLISPERGSSPTRPAQLQYVDDMLGDLPYTEVKDEVDNEEEGEEEREEKGEEEGEEKGEEENEGKDESMNGVAPAVNSLTPNMERLVAALRAGDLMAVISLHASDNSDLYLPFAFCADVPYAVHCAAESKSVALMRWLLEDMHCPTKALQNKNGESVLAVAAREGDVRMMRYLVGQCGVTEIDDIATAHRALHALLEAPGPPPPQARSIRGARLSLPLPTPATLTTAPTAGPPGAAQRASVFDRIADLEVMLASAIFAEQGGGQAETEAEVETDAGEADTPIVSPPNDFTYDSPSTRLDSIALKSGLLVAPPV